MCVYVGYKVNNKLYSRTHFLFLKVYLPCHNEKKIKYLVIFCKNLLPICEGVFFFVCVWLENLSPLVIKKKLVRVCYYFDNEKNAEKNFFPLLLLYFFLGFFWQTTSRKIEINLDKYARKYNSKENNKYKCETTANNILTHTYTQKKSIPKNIK